MILVSALFQEKGVERERELDNTAAMLQRHGSQRSKITTVTASSNGILWTSMVQIVSKIRPKLLLLCGETI